MPLLVYLPSLNPYTFISIKDCELFEDRTSTTMQEKNTISQLGSRDGESAYLHIARDPAMQEAIASVILTQTDIFITIFIVLFYIIIHHGKW